MRLSEAEWKVMHAMWAAGEASAREVHAAVHDATGWAYTTVKTMLDRLVEKDALSARKEGRAAVYLPEISEKEARHSAVGALVEQVFGGATGPLVNFLLEEESLSRRDREKLRKMLEGEGKSQGRGRSKR